MFCSNINCLRELDERDCIKLRYAVIDKGDGTPQFCSWECLYDWVNHPSSKIIRQKYSRKRFVQREVKDGLSTTTSASGN